MYSTKSRSDKGTLFQLRNLLNRRNVSKQPKDNFDACDEFFNTITDSHVVAAAMKIFNMKLISDTPCLPLTKDVCLLHSKEERQDALLAVSQTLVSEFVYLNSEKGTECSDSVFGYACQLLTLGLFYREFCDSIREGDGHRVLRCWRYLLLIFKATGRVNYSIEAFTMLVQYHFLLSQRQSSQLIWSRYVNIHGKPGKNIPADIYPYILFHFLKCFFIILVSILFLNNSGKFLIKYVMTILFHLQY